ncbi:MAG: hypothetical protein KF906_11790 [Actinobacteria bacterium]|nr:hypothetical protein [Actinomycetota bacterium]
MSEPEPTIAAPPSRRSPAPADVLFAALVVAAATVFLQAGSRAWFFADEWAMADQVRSTKGIFHPYNGHLSVLILSLYRVLLGTFGFETYLPYRIAGVASFVSVGAAMYALVRREVGAVAAVVAGAVVLWPRGVSIEPGGLNHSLAALGAVVCAAGLVAPGRRRDLAVAGGLAFALASAGGGVAVAAAAIVHSVLTRARRQRWIAVVVPAAAWLVWYAVAVDEDSAAADLRPGLIELARVAARESIRSFSSITLGNRVGGAVVALVVLAVLVVRLRRGPAAAAGTVGWLVGLYVWWFGLAWSRWLFLDERTFRYEFTSSVLILLALLPSRRRVGDVDPVAAVIDRLVPERVVSAVRSRWAAPVALVLVSVALVPTVRSDAQAWGDLYADLAVGTRNQVASVSFGPDAVPDDVVLGFAIGSREAGTVRDLFDRFEPPSWSGDFDEYVQRTTSLREPFVSTLTCDPVRARAQVEVRPAGEALVIAPEDHAVSVEVGRFGEAPVRRTTLDAGDSVVVVMTRQVSAEPWTVRAEGACLAAR